MEKAEEGKKEVKETETHFLAVRDTYDPSIGKNILGWGSGYLCFSFDPGTWRHSGRKGCSNDDLS